MGFSDYEFDERMEIEGKLAEEYAGVFNNWLYCEYAGRCGGMAERVMASPIKDLKVCSRNPGRKGCEHYIAFERGSDSLRDTG